MKIAILGAGGVGCCIAGQSHEAGVDVTLIDQWPRNVEAIQRSGLRLGGTVPDRTIRVRALSVRQAEILCGRFDAVFLALKSYDTEWGVLLSERLLRDRAPVISVQNGLNEPDIERVIGPGRTLGCVVTIGAELVAPGIVVRTDPPGLAGSRFCVGEWDGSMSRRLKAIGKILSAVGPTTMTANIRSQRWAKLVVNCMLNPISALTGLGTAEVWLFDDARQISIAIGAEALAVASAYGSPVDKVLSVPADSVLRAAEGADLSVHVELKHLASVLAAGAGGRPSSLQDVLRGRRSEIPYLNGLVTRIGRETNVSTPCNDLVVRRLETLGSGFAPSLRHIAGFLDEARRRNRLSPRYEPPPPEIET